MIIETVKLLRDAQGGHCATCGHYFTTDSSPYWHWSKGSGMHTAAMGHRVTYFRFVA